MNNIPKMKIGIVAVSRDCFPESLSVNRRKALVDAYAAKYDAADIYECPVCIVESEIHMVQALEDIKAAGCNALCVYLGNFGPEISETLLAKHFDGPKMFVAAAEETQDNLIQGRGDAYCGMLNASYNLKLRNVGAYIPEYPVGDADDIADMIHDLSEILPGHLPYRFLHLHLFSIDPQDQLRETSNMYFLKLIPIPDVCHQKFLQAFRKYPYDLILSHNSPPFRFTCICICLSPAIIP